MSTYKNFQNSFSQENITESTLKKQGFEGDMPVEVERKNILIEHLEALRASNQNWLSRLTFSKEEKQTIKLYNEKQMEASEIILTSQNINLKAIAEGQNAFIRELVNTLMVTSRGGMQASAGPMLAEYRLQLYKRVDQLSDEFADMIEAAFEKADGRSAAIREMKFEEIREMMAKWRSENQQILNDFAKIIFEKV